MQTNVQVEMLIEKIKHLQPERIGMVIDFVDFINERDNRDERRLVQAATKMSEQSFEKVWNNEEDDVYNRL